MKIVEVVTQVNFKDYIEKVFIDLGMKNTCYNPIDKERAVATSIRDGKDLKVILMMN